MKNKVYIAILLLVSLCGNTWALEPELVCLEVVGPNSVAEESSAQYTAIAVYDNNSTKDVTEEAYWAVMPDNYADINDFGLLDTYELVMPTEDVTIYAEYEEGNDVVGAEKDVQIFSVCPDGALELDGIDDYLLVPDSDTISVGDKDHTLCAWIKPDDIAQSGGAGSNTFSKVKGSADKEYGLKINNGGYLVKTAEKDGNNQSAVTTTAPATIGPWQHIAVTFDADTKEVVFYHNSIVQPHTSTITTLPDQLDDNLYLGKGGGIYTGGHFDGLIDEFIIFNSVLSQEDIWMVMTSGAEMSDPNLAAYWKFNDSQGQIAFDSSGNGNNGYLGSNPGEPDAADPCWVEFGAPLHCTPRQMIVRNLHGALERKRIAKQQIDEALERERASVRLLMDNMQEFKHPCWKPRKIMWPAREIYWSICLEYQCRRSLQQSYEALERALQWLLNDAMPGRPKKAGK